MALIFSGFNNVDLLREAQLRNKTETRRLGRCRWVVGHTYAVKASRTTPGYCRLVVLGLHEERLSAITSENIRKEGLGFLAREKFIELFKRMHRSRCPPDHTLETWDPMVWVIEFELLRFTRKMIKPPQVKREEESEPMPPPAKCSLDEYFSLSAPPLFPAPAQLAQSTHPTEEIQEV